MANVPHWPTIEYSPSWRQPRCSHRANNRDWWSSLEVNEMHTPSLGCTLGVAWVSVAVVGDRIAGCKVLSLLGDLAEA